MKKISIFSYHYFLFLPIALFIMVFPIYGQQGNYIVAGEITDAIYHDYNPDVQIDLGDGGIFYMDIDMDGSNDFGIKTLYTESMGAVTYYIRVLSYGANQLGYSQIIPITLNGDTTGWATMGIGYSSGAIIDSTINFTTDFVRLISYWEVIEGYWSGFWAAGDYIPVCLQKEGDSVGNYGWIEVADVGFLYGITIKSHAVKNPEITSIPSRLQSKIKIYPNPTDRGLVTIALDKPYNELQLICFNTVGQQIYDQELETPETTIAVNSWDPGIYLAVVYERGAVVGQMKFIIR